MTPTPSVAYETALMIAAGGWPVFPIRPNSKIPMTKRGVLDATTEAHVIESWLGPLGRWPWQTNLAIATGDKSAVVLDVDGLAGTESLAKLEAEHGQLPPTRTVRTPSGGMHLYFKPLPDARNSAGRIGPGLDIRGAGGYVLCPPSEINGRPYTTVSRGFAAMPPWLVDRIQAAPARRRPTPTSEWLRMLTGIPEGERNASLARLAGHLLNRHIDEQVTVGLLHAVNRTACRPPLDDREIERIVESILRRELRKAAA